MAEQPITVDLYKIGDFATQWAETVEKINRKMSEGNFGPFSIAISVKIKREGVSLSGRDFITANATLQLKGPKPEKLESGQAELFRENGTLKLAPDNQEKIGFEGAEA